MGVCQDAPWGSIRVGACLSIGRMAGGWRLTRGRCTWGMVPAIEREARSRCSQLRHFLRLLAFLCGLRTHLPFFLTKPFLHFARATTIARSFGKTGIGRSSRVIGGVSVAGGDMVTVGCSTSYYGVGIGGVSKIWSGPVVVPKALVVTSA